MSRKTWNRWWTALFSVVSALYALVAAIYWVSERWGFAALWTFLSAFATGCAITAYRRSVNECGC